MMLNTKIVFQFKNKDRKLKDLKPIHPVRDNAKMSNFEVPKCNYGTKRSSSLWINLDNN